MPTSTPTISPTPTLSVNYPVKEGTTFPLPLEPISQENANRVIELASWGQGKPEHLALSPNGQELAIIFSNGARYYNPDTLEDEGRVPPAELNQLLPRTINIIPAPIELNQSSSEAGSYRAVIVGDEIQILNRADGSLVRQLSPRGQVLKALLSPDGELLLFEQFDNGVRAVRVLRISDGSLVKSLELDDNRHIESFSFSHDGRFLLLKGAVQGENNQSLPYTQVWRWEDWQSILDLVGVEDTVLSTDGSLMASWPHLTSENRDIVVKLWRLEDGQLLRTLSGHDSSINQVVFSPGDAYLAVITTDIFIWNIATGSKAELAEGYSCTYDCQLMFIPSQVREDGEPLLVVLGVNSGTVSAWQVSDGSLVETIHKGDEFVSDMAFSTDGHRLTYILRSRYGLSKSIGGERYFACSSKDRGYCFAIRQRTSDGYVEDDHKFVGEYVPNIVPDSETLLVANFDVWYPAYQLHHMSDLEAYVNIDPNYGATNFGFSPDGKSLLLHDNKNTVSVYSLPDGNRVFQMQIPLSSEESRRKAHAIATPLVEIYDELSAPGDFAWKDHNLINQEILITIMGIGERSYAIDKSTGGYIHVAAGKIFIDKWRISDGNFLSTIDEISITPENQPPPIHDNSVPVVTSPDGKYFAIGVAGLGIRLYDIAEEELFRQVGSSDTAYKLLAFTQDGQILLAESNDRLDLWRMEDGASLVTLATESIDVYAISNDGSILAIGTSGRLDFWDTHAGQRLLSLPNIIKLDDLVFSSDKRLVAGASEDGTIYLWGVGR